jgi:phosphatidylglycerol:prolipoprotein diacylglycerol transferase
VSFPDIDPIALQIGPLAIRWYALAYITGLLSGWALMRRFARPYAGFRNETVDDFLTWATLGVVLGGRLGYVLFYKPSYYLSQPLDIFKVWEGGMSFHGGCLGVIIAAVLFAKRRGLSHWVLGDLITAVVPLGLFFGRIANFINGELFGRVTSAEEVPWAMVFPHGGPYPRHPSQIYEALLEGLTLFAILMVVRRLPVVRRHPGMVTGFFLAGYGVARFICEFFREPDAFLGYLWGGATMGQLLSLPMIALGVGLAVWALRRPPLSTAELAPAETAPEAAK